MNETYECRMPIDGGVVRVSSVEAFKRVCLARQEYNDFDPRKQKGMSRKKYTAYKRARLAEVICLSCIMPTPCPAGIAVREGRLDGLPAGVELL